MTRSFVACACATFLATACAAKPNYAHPDGGESTGGGTSGGGSTSDGAIGGGGSTGADGGTGGALADTTTQSYEADDANIQYMGRVNFTNAKQPRFDLGGTTITARFTGTAVAVSLKDEFRYGKYVNSYDALIDDVKVMTIVPRTGVTKYVVANDLKDGQHKMTLVKRTEAAAGAAWFLGVSFAGTILPPPDRPTRRLEFIGDSITAGAGVDAANGTPGCTAPPDGWGLTVENSYKAYGPVIATELLAEYHVMGVSGIGLVRNYSDMYDPRTIPQLYDLYYPELMDSTGKMDQPRWDATQRMTWVPDAIVIGLGTNDFGTGDPTDTTHVQPRPPLTAEAFAAGYITFIDKLRGYYPNAHVFIVSSPVLMDPDLESGLKMTEDHFTAAGDPKVHQFIFAKINGAACGTHPDAAQHAALAQLLSPFIKQKLGWP